MLLFMMNLKTLYNGVPTIKTPRISLVGPGSVSIVMFFGCNVLVIILFYRLCTCETIIYFSIVVSGFVDHVFVVFSIFCSVMSMMSNMLNNLGVVIVVDG
jgi:hypothetical protein